MCHKSGHCSLRSPRDPSSLSSFFPRPTLFPVYRHTFAFFRGISRRNGTGDRVLSCSAPNGSREPFGDRSLVLDGGTTPWGGDDGRVHLMSRKRYRLTGDSSHETVQEELARPEVGPLDPSLLLDPSRWWDLRFPTCGLGPSLPTSSAVVEIPVSTNGCRRSERPRRTRLGSPVDKW